MNEKLQQPVSLSRINEWIEEDLRNFSVPVDFSSEFVQQKCAPLGVQDLYCPLPNAFCSVLDSNLGQQQIPEMEHHKPSFLEASNSSCLLYIVEKYLPCRIFKETGPIRKEHTAMHKFMSYYMTF